MDAMIAKAQRSHLHPGLCQILGRTVIVNRMIGSLRGDDEGWNVGKIGKATRRCLLLPAGNEIRSIRLRLLFGRARYDPTVVSKSEGTGQ